MLTVKVLPANCGDCIIVSFDDGYDGVKNILIDGGAGTELVPKNQTTMQ